MLYGQESKYNVLFIQLDDDLIGESLAAKTNYFSSFIIQKFGIEQPQKTMMEYPTWDRKNDAEKEEYLKNKGYNLVFVTELKPLGDKLQIVINLLDSALQPVFPSESRLFSEFLDSKDSEWIKNKIENYYSFIETGELRKEFVIVKLNYKNSNRFEEFDFDQSDIESFVQEIPMLLKEYAEELGKDTSIVQLRKKYNYQYVEERNPNFKNVVYGEISVQDSVTIMVKIKGKLDSNQIRPKSTQKGIEIYSLQKDVLRLAENIFYIVNENLNEQ